jgi:hypothetical protein
MSNRPKREEDQQSPHKAQLLPRPTTSAGRSHELEFILAWVALSSDAPDSDAMDTSGLVACCGAKLVHVLDTQPLAFTARGLSSLEPTAMKLWCGGCPMADGFVAEHVRVLRDLGSWLERDCGGLFANAITASKGRLAGRGGLLARLARTEAYSNPRGARVQRLFRTLDTLQLFSAVDPETLRL